MLSDEALTERMLAGDLTAFDVLYARHERHLLGFIRGILGEPSEAEDVLHEAFIALLREGKAGRSVQSFRAWIFRTARNLCLNRLRSRARAARAAEAADLPDPADLPERAIESRQAVDVLRVAVAGLPQELAQLFRLRAAGMSYQELADVLAIPLRTVKSRLRQMIDLLRGEVRR